jgi:hypothetical protein
MITTEEKILLSFNLACRIENIQRKNCNGAAFVKKNGLYRKMEVRLFHEGYNPSFHTICKIAKALEVRPKELFDFNLKVKAERQPNGLVPRSEKEEKEAVRYQHYKW